jgi:RNA polymerase sigma-70 factor (ECF subfamily)
MMEEDRELMDSVRAAAAGDQNALRQLMDRFRKPLAGMVGRRMGSELKARVDASDVVQDAYLEAWKHLPDYIANPALPFPIWLRQIVLQQSVATYRTHVMAQRRSAHREKALEPAPGAPDESRILADRLTGDDDSPSQAAMREERRKILIEALDSMEPNERDILTLRHFDGLTSEECAEFLGITPAAASKRYIRAIKRLQGILHQRKIAGDLSLGPR